jgi:C4-dicarboxylate-binding protein DctP
VDAAEEAAAAAPGNLAAKGVNVYTLTAEENAAMEAVMKPAFDAAFGEGDADSQKLLDLIDQLRTGS